MCCFLPTLLLIGSLLPAAPPATQPAVGQFPHVQVDLKKRQVRIECQSLNPTMPLEFFCVKTGTSEHESVLRTEALPEHIHTALLMLGLQPGAPVHYDPAQDKWIAPHGPPLHIYCETVKDNNPSIAPAGQWMRNVKTKQPAPPFTWVFTGSRLTDNGTYAANLTGYVVSVVNFDLTVIDIPQLASSDNQTLQWEYNPDMVPPTGSPVTMIIEPADAPQPATTQPAE
ncbi:MAG: hypothetical protein IT446_08375 [Phycisphaerales bacterium]|nr:hypothetical protein [Phycisphaerales bacterium]